MPILAMALMLPFASCSDSTRDVVYSQFASIAPAGWGRDFPVDFDIVVDSQYLASHPRCDLMLVVRHSDAYPAKSLFLQVERTTESGTMSVDTIEMKLTTSEGEWTGRGLRAIREVTDTIARGIDPAEVAHIAVSHCMADHVLPGINNIGVVMTKL